MVISNEAFANAVIVFLTATLVFLTVYQLLEEGKPKKLWVIILGICLALLVAIAFAIMPFDVTEQNVTFVTHNISIVNQQVNLTCHNPNYSCWQPFWLKY